MKIFFNRKGDLYILVFCILLSAVLLIIESSKPETVNKKAYIKNNDKIIYQIDLESVKKPYIIELKGELDRQIKVERGRIRFLSSDCQEKICIKTGWLERAGDISVCVPSRTIIIIEGDTESDIDTILR